MGDWAVVTTSYPAHEGDPSGHFVRAEVRALEESGHRVTVFFPEPGGAFGWPGAASRLRENPSRALEAAGWMLDTRRAVGRHAWQGIVAHWCVPSLWPILTPGRTLRRCVGQLEVLSHGGDVRLLVGLPAVVRHGIVESAIAAVDRWRFVSEYLLRTLTDTLPRELAHRLERLAEVCPARIETPTEEAGTAIETAIASMVPYVACVGRLVPSKAVDEVILRATAQGQTLIIVGDGPERARLEALARRLGARGRIHFLGLRSRAETLAWIRGASAVWMASRHEGLSTVEREARALEVPVEWLPGSHGTLISSLDSD